MNKNNWHMSDANPTHGQNKDGEQVAQTTIEQVPLEEAPKEPKMKGKWKKVRPVNNPQPSYYDTLPASMKNSNNGSHPHWLTGEPCNCTFYTAPEKTSKWVVLSSKLDKIIQENPKVLRTEEGQKVLEWLKKLPEKVDPLIPWLVREYKKQRVSPILNRTQDYVLAMKTPSLDTDIDEGLLSHWSDWLSDKKTPTRRGVDIMQLSVDDMLGKIGEWDEELEERMKNAPADLADDGQVLYRYPNGWTMRDLLPEECRGEGDAMGHCVGGYSEEVRRGDKKILSLRDPQNRPHATLEVLPNGSIVQIQGKQNAHPKGEYRKMIREFIENAFKDKMGVEPGSGKEIRDWEDFISPEYDEYGYYGGDDEFAPSWDEGYHDYHPAGRSGYDYSPVHYGIDPSSMPIDYESVLRSSYDRDSEWADDERFISTDTYPHSWDLYGEAKNRGQVPLLAEGYQRSLEDRGYSNPRDKRDSQYAFPSFDDNTQGGWRDLFERATGLVDPKLVYSEGTPEFEEAMAEYKRGWNQWIQSNFMNGAPWPMVNDDPEPSLNYHQDAIRRRNMREHILKRINNNALQHLLEQHKTPEGAYVNEIVNPLPKDERGVTQFPGINDELQKSLMEDADYGPLKPVHKDQLSLISKWKKVSYFEEFDTDSGANPPFGDYFLVKDPETQEVIGSAYYDVQPQGTNIYYIGYGDKLHPENDADKIADIKSRYPRIGVEIFKWVRANLPEPYFAAFANQDLKRVLRAEPTGQYGMDVVTGEPVSIDIIRRSKWTRVSSKEYYDNFDYRVFLRAAKNAADSAFVSLKDEFPQQRMTQGNLRMIILNPQELLNEDMSNASHFVEKFLMDTSDISEYGTESDEVIESLKQRYQDVFLKTVNFVQEILNSGDKFEGEEILNIYSALLQSNWNSSNSQKIFNIFANQYGLQKNASDENKFTLEEMGMINDLKAHGWNSGYDAAIQENVWRNVTPDDNAERGVAGQTDIFVPDLLAIRDRWHSTNSRRLQKYWNAFPDIPEFVDKIYMDYFYKGMKDAIDEINGGPEAKFKVSQWKVSAIEPGTNIDTLRNNITMQPEVERPAWKNIWNPSEAFKENPTQLEFHQEYEIPSIEFIKSKIERSMVSRLNSFSTRVENELNEKMGDWFFDDDSHPWEDRLGNLKEFIAQKDSIINTNPAIQQADLYFDEFIRRSNVNWDILPSDVKAEALEFFKEVGRDYAEAYFNDIVIVNYRTILGNAAGTEMRNLLQTYSTDEISEPVIDEVVNKIREATKGIPEYYDHNYINNVVIATLMTLLNEEEDRQSRESNTKTSHWIKGYHAAIIDNNGNFKIADSPNEVHGMLIDEDDWNQFEDGNYHRGLYNPETQELIHMTTPDEMRGQIERNKENNQFGVEYLTDSSKFENPQQTIERWQEAAKKAGVPVSSIKFMTHTPSFNNMGFPDVEFSDNKEPEYFTLTDPSQVELPSDLRRKWIEYQNDKSQRVRIPQRIKDVPGQWNKKVRELVERGMPTDKAEQQALVDRFNERYRREFERGGKWKKVVSNNEWSTPETEIVMQEVNTDPRITRSAMSQMEKIVRRGGSVNDLAQWMVQNIVQPYNDHIRQQWENISDEQDVEAQKNEHRKVWRQQAWKQSPFNRNKRRQHMNEMEEMQYGLLGDPEPARIEDYLLDISRINWQEIYDDIFDDLRYRGKMAKNSNLEYEFPKYIDKEFIEEIQHSSFSRAVYRYLQTEVHPEDVLKVRGPQQQTKIYAPTQMRENYIDGFLEEAIQRGLSATWGSDWVSSNPDLFADAVNRFYQKVVVPTQNATFKFLAHKLTEQPRLAERFRELKKRDDWQGESIETRELWYEFQPNHKLAKNAWEVVIDGEMGHDTLTTGTFEEVKQKTEKWLKQFKDGYINKKNPHDNDKIDSKAKEQDKHALTGLKAHDQEKRWTFHFDHGKHPYDLILQPVGYKESKWKKVATPDGWWDREADDLKPSSYFNTKVVEEIPVDVAMQMLDVDRGQDEAEQENIQSLVNHISQHGFLSPIIIEFNRDDSTAHIGEGNHRVQAARALGLEWIPARVVRSGRQSRFREIPVQWQGTQTDFRGVPYIPPHMPPHMIGLPVKEKVKGFEDGVNYNGWENRESKWQKTSEYQNVKEMQAAYKNMGYKLPVQDYDAQQKIRELKRYPDAREPRGVKDQLGLEQELLRKDAEDLKNQIIDEVVMYNSTLMGSTTESNHAGLYLTLQNIMKNFGLWDPNKDQDEALAEFIEWKDSVVYQLVSDPNIIRRAFDDFARRRISIKDQIPEAWEIYQPIAEEYISAYLNEQIDKWAESNERRRQSKWQKVADYNGWTNWETFNADAIMSSDYNHHTFFNDLIARGGSLEDFTNAAIQRVVAPYNKELQDDFSSITDEEEVNRKMMHDLDEWWAKARQKFPDDPDKQQEYVLKMRDTIYGLAGEPQASDIANHWLDESKINWQELYEHWKNYEE